MSSKNLTFFAGKKALARIREKGLRQKDVKVVAGAAGGPKWLVLSHFDRLLFSSWFKGRKEPLFLIGSSIGSWRFAAVSQNNPRKDIEKIKTAYINQRYSSKPSPEDVTRESKKILDYFIDDNGIGQILTHPYLRLNLMAVRSKWPVSMENKLLLGLGLAVSAIFNAFNRNLLKHFFERSLFFHPGDIPPFANMNGFSIQKNPLSEKNLKEALLASGSIPIVMSGVKNIPGALEGVYRDGGVIDYHMDIPFVKDDNKIALYPHYTNRIIPGWFDKNLSWRKPCAANMDNVVLVSPSSEFVKNLPYGKIPDRNDFILFKGRDNERISYWNDVVDASFCLGEEFLDLVETGKIKGQLMPMTY